MLKIVNCTSSKFFPLLITLGNHVQKFLAGDNDMYYIILPDEITPDISAILLTHCTIASPMTEQVKNLEGNTPINLRYAIQKGELSHPGWGYQHLWEAVCKKAGIVELTYAQQVANVALTAALYTLWGAGKVVEAVSSLRK